MVLLLVLMVLVVVVAVAVVVVAGPFWLPSTDPHTSLHAAILGRDNAAPTI